MCDIDMDDWEKGFNMTEEEFEQWQHDIKYGIDPEDERNWDDDGNWIG